MKGSDQADLQLFVAMAGRPVPDMKTLVNIRADLYHFDLTLKRDKETWKVEKAKWRQANIDDFLPR